jgi:hypothetical protein
MMKKETTTITYKIKTVVQLFYLLLLLLLMMMMQTMTTTPHKMKICWASSDVDEDDKETKRNATSTYKTGIRKADTGCSWRVSARGFRAAGCSFVEGFGPSV